MREIDIRLNKNEFACFLVLNVTARKTHDDEEILVEEI